jgi:ADP-heptose:LPS heptosyltransferase
VSTLDERWQGARRLLAMRLDNIGDVIMTGPALRAVKEALPSSDLTLMVSQGGSAAAGLLPWVDHVLVWRSLWQDMGALPFDPAREFGLIQTLQSLRFDAAIIFTSFAQTPHVAAYACYLAGIPLRLGEPKDFGGAVLSNVPPSPSRLEMHQVERNLRLLEAVGIAPSDRSLSVYIPAEAHARAADLLSQRLPPGTPYVLLSPWTSCQARTYPRFGAVGRLLHRVTGLPVVVAGAQWAQEQVARLLEALGPGAIDLAGQTTVGELAALVAGARLVLTNNTATMHLADATRTPQVVLFAGTELEEQWVPRHGPARVLRRPTPCHPCFQLACSHDLACLDVAPDQVVATALDLLQGNPAAQARPGKFGARPW